MKIQESQVNLSASHEASLSRSVEIETEIGFREIFRGLAEAPAVESGSLRERVRQMLESLIERILAAMDGRPCQEKTAGDVLQLPADSIAGADAVPQAPRLREMSWSSRICERIVESESTQVCGNGKVKTADGRQIDFAFAVDMQRHYEKESTLEESGRVELRDPLMLAFDGKACELTDQRLAFDLDADGTAEWIPQPGANTCLLVWDRNGNGRADNGSELFGVASGNGFADLAQLDKDGNGWIDEADPAFSELALWSGERFDGLLAGGVGALYTAAVDAPFALKNRDNELLGQIRAAGVYLAESGQVGLMQQVDLAVSAAPPGQQQPGEGERLGA